MASSLEEEQLLQLLSKGSLVEVCTDEEGFKGVWFEATIIEPTTRSATKKKKKEVYVEYSNLVSDEDGKKPLRELVNPKCIRPRPPPLHSPKPLELYDIVDASYKDGFWTGVVTRILDNSRYTVTFCDPPDELDFPLSDLRLHQRWLNGQWVRPDKQNAVTFMNIVGKKVEVAFEEDDFRDAWFPAKIVEHDFVNGSFLVEYNNPNDGGKLLRVTVDALHTRPCPPLVKYNNKPFDLLDKVDAFYNFAWRSGSVTKLLSDSSYCVFNENENKVKEFRHNQLRHRWDWVDGKWYIFTRLGFKEVSTLQDCTIEVGDACSDSNVIQNAATNKNPGESMSSLLNSDGDKSEQPAISIKKPSNARVSPMKGRQHLKQHLNKCHQKTNECDALHQLSNTYMETRKKRHKIGEREISMSSAQKKEGSTTKSLMKDPQLSAPQGKEGKEEGIAAECNKTYVPIIIGLESVPPSGAKRRRSFFCKEYSTAKTDQKDLSNPERDGVKESKEEALTSQQKKRGRLVKTLVSTRGYRGNKGRLSTAMKTLAKVPNDKPQHKRKGNSGKGKPVEVNIESQIPDAADTCGGKDAECIAVEEVIAEASINCFEDQPLSKWIAEMQSSTAASNGSRLAPVSNGEQHNEARDKSKEIVVRNPAIGNDATMSSHLPNLPFVKNTLLWNTIESMEVFRNIPQKPHFRPLENCKESSREGLAIGCMVTFSSVVEKANTLDLEEPRSTIDEMLDTLCELESHGFDVEAVRCRLNEMLSLKDKQENVTGMLSISHSEMEKHNEEVAKIDEEVDELKKQLAELEKKLSEGASRKEAKKADIATLRSRMDEMNNEINNLRGDFQALTRKPIMTL